MAARPRLYTQGEAYVPDGLESEAGSYDDSDPDESSGDESEDLVQSGEDSDGSVELHPVEPSNDGEPNVISLPKSGQKNPPKKRHPKRLPDQAFRWRNIRLAERDTTFKGPQFPEPETDRMGELPSPLSYFDMFITPAIIQTLTLETNSYSVLKKGASINVSQKEMKQFLGMLLFMGVTQLPFYRAYWQPLTRISLIADAMSVNRFEEIRQYFHICDNAMAPNPDDPNRDRFFKVRPLLESFRAACRSVTPEERQSIDEQMIPFKGRSGVRQYLPKKPKKWGFKFWARCGVSGFVYDFMPYDGRTPEAPQGIDYMGLGGNVVLNLCEPLFGEDNFKVYFDNFFTSLELVQELNKKGILCVGTINRNRLRGCVLANTKPATMERGQWKNLVDANSSIGVVQWKDNNIVELVSNYAGVEPVTQARRWDGKLRRHVDVPSPNIVKEYNTNMGGVDLSDMLAALYRINHRSKKYYMRIVFWCLNTAVSNAWLLYRRQCGQLGIQPREQLSLYQYCTQIAQGCIEVDRRPLVGPLCGKVRRRRGRPSSQESGDQMETPAIEDVNLPTTSTRYQPRNPEPTNDSLWDQMGHFPIYSENLRKNRCRLCGKTTTVICKKCSGSGTSGYHLCFVPGRNCFSVMHEGL